MSRWPTMKYYDWLDWCEAEGADPTARVFVSSIEGVAEWHLGVQRFDGQPPLDAFVNVPLWALERVWNRVTSPPPISGNAVSGVRAGVRETGDPK